KRNISFVLEYRLSLSDQSILPKFSLFQTTTFLQGAELEDSNHIVHKKRNRSTKGSPLSFFLFMGLGSVRNTQLFMKRGRVWRSATQMPTKMEQAKSRLSVHLVWIMHWN